MGIIRRVPGEGALFVNVDKIVPNRKKHPAIPAGNFDAHKGKS
jgi:hypothetical protein